MDAAVAADAVVGNVASWQLVGHVAAFVVADAVVLTVVAAVALIGASFDLAIDHSHCRRFAVDYTCLATFREMAPYSTADSNAYHCLIASMMAAAWDSFDALDNLVAFVTDAVEVVQIVG